MIPRSFVPSDAEALAEVYRDAVRGIGPQAYSAEQVAAWASYLDNLAEFRDRMSHGLTLVTEEASRVIAFGQLEPVDHLAFLYRSAAHARRGIGSKIYAALEAHAISCGVSEIRTEASRISRPFFEKQGYAVVAIEHVNRFGLEFERFRMRKKSSEQKAPTWLILGVGSP
jgi:putative acetyltransferase